jgi:predicted alpha-1,2-mannosidase
MKNILCTLSFLILLSQNLIAQKKTSNVQYIDPTIGSVGLLLVPTRPTAHLPNSMIRVFPSRKDQIDDQIDFFPLSISSHRQPNLFSLMPVSGSYTNASWKKSFTWYNETTTPYYYAVRLEENGDSVEFTPSARSGFFRFHFLNNDPHFLRFGILNNGGSINVEGKRIITGSDSVKALPAFFYAEINTDIIETRFADNSQKQLLARVDDKEATVELRYGISFISIEQAKQNMLKEVGTQTFTAIKQKAFDVWNKTLSQVNVKGGSEAQKKVFYTSLYRSYERMININEYGKYYSAYDRKVHELNKPFYVDNWLWDTYIALEPLHTILNPQMEVDKINSYISMYEQSGWMPSFALAFGDDPCMTGNHAAAWMADVWIKGNQSFDLTKAYEGLKKNSLTATLLPWRNGPATSLDRFYNEKGYMPSLYSGEKETVMEVHGFEKRQAVSVTLENSFDDWCIAQLANVLNKKEDRDLFLKRAANYKNVFRTDKGFVWPKDEKGNWIEPFDPKFSGGQGGRNYTTENNAYTWNWSVKHDLQGLFQLMGGKEKAEAKLDNLFEEGLDRSKYDYWYTFPDATGLVGQFVMGNEPSFHIPYLYNYTGSPWKTQKRIRMLLDTWYTDNLFGIPGDEDGGGMTAFVVFSMMGFFPVTPGIPVYNIGSPLFENISINLSNGKTFTVIAKNNSSVNRYIQSATLNGKEWNKPWFTHASLMNGGTLELIMGPTPNKSWGADDQSAPPSKMDLNPVLFNKSF